MLKVTLVEASCSSFYDCHQLLGRGSGFQVASTHRPCTKGLWMWSTPLKRIAADGTEYSLLLLDTEGIDAYDQTVWGLSFFGIYDFSVLFCTFKCLS